MDSPRVHVRVSGGSLEKIKNSMVNFSLRISIGLALLCVGSGASAQVFAVDRFTTPAADLGNVISATSGDTVFRIDSSTGAVTRVSGTGTRTSTGTARATVAISCSRGGKPDLCLTTKALVTIGAIGSSGRASSPANFNVTPGTAIMSSPKSGNTISFEVEPFGPNTVTFYLGADIAIAGETSGVATGPATSEFYVTVSRLDGSGASTRTAEIETLVLRPLSVANSSPLEFGRMIRPATGTGSVTIDAKNGARTFTGSVTGLSSPLPTRSVFDVTGEGGQALSITIPGTFSINSGEQSIIVNTSNDLPKTPSLTGKAGAAGTLTFGIGGSFGLSDTTKPGNYTGTFTVSVSYN